MRDVGIGELAAVVALPAACPICGETLPRPEGAERPTVQWFAVECGRGLAPHWAGRARFWTRQADEPAGGAAA